MRAKRLSLCGAEESLFFNSNEFDLEEGSCLANVNKDGFVDGRASALNIGGCTWSCESAEVRRKR